MGKTPFDPSSFAPGTRHNDPTDLRTISIAAVIFLVSVLGLVTMVGFDNEPHLDPETVWDAPFERP